MIICVCRNLNSGKVQAAIDDGARTPAMVLAHHGCRFNCGKCRPEIASLIGEGDQTGQGGAPITTMAAE